MLVWNWQCGQNRCPFDWPHLHPGLHHIPHQQWKLTSWYSVQHRSHLDSSLHGHACKYTGQPISVLWWQAQQTRSTNKSGMFVKKNHNLSTIFFMLAAGGCPSCSPWAIVLRTLFRAETIASWPTSVNTLVLVSAAQLSDGPCDNL